MTERPPEMPQPLPAPIAVRGDGADVLARRAHAEPPHPYRGPFARDAARILHTRAFRRLAGKTQVFTRSPGSPATGLGRWGDSPGSPATGLGRWGDSHSDPLSDHFRSRLTHTLEVTQIARTLARVLGLNVELAEALALVHDIGHPPFGHAGEQALDRALSAHGLRFDHNLHALRIVTWFEERYPGFRGLNLTLGVREGIVKHSRDYPPAAHPELKEYFLDEFPPLEAQLIDPADEIAYLTADLDDGLDAGILALDQVREALPLFRGFHQETLRSFPQAAPRLAVYDALRRMLNALVTDLLCEMPAQVKALGAGTLAEVRRAPRRLAVFSAPMEQERAAAKSFLYAHFYNSPGMEEAHRHAENVVTGLFAALLAQPELMPADHQAEIPAQGLARTVADYIAGMTDSYIEQLWARHGAGRTALPN